MSKVIITESHLSDIADAIRGKNGQSAQYTPGQMAAAIAAIPTGGAPVLDQLSVNQNGTYTPPAGVDGFDEVIVNVSGGGGDWESLTDYIESSGTQWIDTGYTTKLNTKYEAVVNVSDTTHNWPCVFGARATDGDNDASQSALLAFSWNNGYINPMWGTGSSAFDSKANYLEKKTKIELSADGALLLTDGIVCRGAALTATSYSPTDQYSIWLFNLNNHGGEFSSATRCNMKLYRFRIYEGSALVHEFVPWTDNGVACLKDTVTGNLKYNAGTGAFVRGSDT